MKTFAIVLFAASIASTAAADPCDSDESSSSSIDSDSSSDESYSSGECPFEPSYDHSPSSSSDDDDDGVDYDPCATDSPVVGSSECRRYGDGWDQTDVPPMVLELGLGTRRLALFDGALTGATEHDGNRYDVEFTADDIENRWVGAIELRLAGFLTENLYIGAVGALGAAPTGGAVSVEDVSIEAVSLVHVGAQAVAGISIPIGDTSLRAEVLGGVRYVEVGFQSRRVDCVNHETLSYFVPVIEPRLGLDMFLGSWISVGAYGGMNLLELGELSAGANVTLHFRAFDAR
jgi:hypothetical protein